MTTFFATCPQGLEYPLQRELEALGARGLAETRAGVSFEGDLALGMRCCLWSRVASRILLPLATGPIEDADGLYELAAGIRWQDHLMPGARFAVHVAARHPGIGNTHFAALRIKDAVVDQLGRAVVVDTAAPEVRLYGFADQEAATIGINLSTRSLHERGYRHRPVLAPLKENLAAAILWRAGWPDAPALLDPFCGSGTLLIEAAWMAADVAPGLLNPAFGFRRLAGFDAAAWNKLMQDAEERRRDGVATMKQPLIGCDHDPTAIAATRTNCKAAGIGQLVRVEQRSIRQLERPTDWIDGGLLVTNPPYGERLDPGQRGLFELYRVLGEIAAQDFVGSRLALLTGHDELAREIELPLADRYRLFNGPLPVRLFVFDIPAAAREPTDGATMVANRIRKNLRNLKRYLRDGDITCYRAYDADIPEYAVAVDVYEGRLHIQEYQAPKTIPEGTARRRLKEAVTGARMALEVPPGEVYVKARARQRGEAQYERQSEEGAVYWVHEGELEFRVNLSDYLDTGLFLDHRETRARIRALAQGRRFLNLFGYTGTATVHAAAGGAESTTTVDLSNTYLEWARENLDRNGYGGGYQHRYIRADVMRWLADCRESYDLIFLDPPTFSTSKKMHEAFDVQRDHAALIDQCMQRLSPGGVLIFSNNFRQFKLDPALATRYRVTEITDQTVPPDFNRSRPHRCWQLTAVESEK